MDIIPPVLSFEFRLGLAFYTCGTPVEWEISLMFHAREGWRSSRAVFPFALRLDFQNRCVFFSTRMPSEVVS